MPVASTIRRQRFGEKPLGVGMPERAAKPSAQDIEPAYVVSVVLAHLLARHIAPCPNEIEIAAHRSAAPSGRDPQLGRPTAGVAGNRLSLAVSREGCECELNPVAAA